MNSIVNKSYTRFLVWISATDARKPLVLFRIVFASIWLTYDMIDIFLGETMKIFWFYRLPVPPHFLFGVQLILIACELALLLGWNTRTMAFCAFLARLCEARYAMLNDFFYFCVAALLLSLCDCGNDSRGRPKRQTTLAWPRELFVIQTAWIYFASALLKLNPTFLSGGDLYVRQNYAASVLPLPYPQFYRSLIATLSGNSVLAWSAVIMEMSLAVVLFSWAFWPAQRKRFHTVATILVLAIHCYAAYALNVFFFGASMIAQVILLTQVPSDFHRNGSEDHRDP